MSNLHDHIGPIVDQETDLAKAFKGIKNTFAIMWHGICPHKSPQPPKEEIKAEYFAGGSESNYSSAQAMYNESQERIKHLEEKAFKLLTYISALSAILFFLLGKEINTTTSVCIVISIIILVIAMVISLRCIGVKTQKAFFIDNLFSFPEDVRPSVNNRDQIAAGLVNCAVFNQTVADNTADILKASRYFLSIGICTTVIAAILFFTAGSPEKQIQDVRIVEVSPGITDSLRKDRVMIIVPDSARAKEGIEVVKLGAGNTSNVWSTISSLIALTIGAILIALGAINKKRRALLFTLGGLSLISSLTIQLADKMNFKLADSLEFKFKGGDHPTDSTIRKYSDRINYTTFDTIAKLTGFIEADTLLENEATESVFINSVLEKCRPHNTKDSLVALVIVGSVDKRPLRPVPTSKYGSNTNLAIARANHISRLFFIRDKSLKNKILVLPSGANFIGLGINPVLMENDRSVTVYGIWNKRLEN